MRRQRATKIVLFIKIRSRLHFKLLMSQTIRVYDKLVCHRHHVRLRVRHVPVAWNDHPPTNNFFVHQRVRINAYLRTVGFDVAVLAPTDLKLVRNEEAPVVRVQQDQIFLLKLLVFGSFAGEQSLKPLEELDRVDFADI